MSDDERLPIRSIRVDGLREDPSVTKFAKTDGLSTATGSKPATDKQSGEFAPLPDLYTLSQLCLPYTLEILRSNADNELVIQSSNHESLKRIYDYFRDFGVTSAVDVSACEFLAEGKMRAKTERQFTQRHMKVVWDQETYMAPVPDGGEPEPPQKTKLLLTELRFHDHVYTGKMAKKQVLELVKKSGVTYETKRPSNPQIFLALVQGVLGYKLLHASGESWYFQREKSFDEVPVRTFDDVADA
jgi:hypothetical protein